MKKNNIIIVSNEQLIKKAERQSFNARIQGGAATLTKMIMVMVSRDSLIKKLGGRIVFGNVQAVDSLTRAVSRISIGLTTEGESNAAAESLLAGEICTTCYAEAVVKAVVAF